MIIKASDSSFWQTMLAGAQQGRRRLRPQGRPLRPDVGDRRQPAGPARRELDLARRRRDRPRAELLGRAQQRDQARPQGRDQGRSLADTAVTTPARGLHRHRQRQGRRAGGRAHVPARQAAGQDVRRRDDRVLGRRHPDAQGPRRRLPPGLAAACPQVTVASPRFNNNDINTAASQVNDVAHRQPEPGRDLRRQQHLRAPARPARSRTTTPPTGSRSSPSTPTRRRTRR